MIRLERAGVRFGARWILKDLDLVVNEGTCLAVLGPNGRGKTTLIRTILGMQRLQEGRRTAPTLIGYVPQAGNAPPHYRVLDMVVMGRAKELGVFGAPAAADYAAAKAALAAVGLCAIAERSFSVLSGGERQLVLVARALATGATTIVLDEPSSALDLANQSRLLAIIRNLAENPAYTIVFSTHHPQHALHVADDVLLLMEGCVLRGPADLVMTEKNLRELYGVDVRRIPLPGGGDALVPLLERPPTPNGQPLVQGTTVNGFDNAAAPCRRDEGSP